MNAVSMRGARRVDDSGNREITLNRWSEADRDGAIGRSDMRRLCIGIRIDRHGLDAEFSTCVNDANGNLAAIGDKEAIQHGPTHQLPDGRIAELQKVKALSPFLPAILPSCHPAIEEVIRAPMMVCAFRERL